MDSEAEERIRALEHRIKTLEMAEKARESRITLLDASIRVARHAQTELQERNRYLRRALQQAEIHLSPLPLVLVALQALQPETMEYREVLLSIELVLDLVTQAQKPSVFDNDGS